MLSMDLNDSENGDNAPPTNEVESVLADAEVAAAEDALEERHRELKLTAGEALVPVVTGAAGVIGAATAGSGPALAALVAALVGTVAAARSSSSQAGTGDEQVPQAPETAKAMGLLTAGLMERRRVLAEVLSEGGARA
jgi:hypothetical protein